MRAPRRGGRNIARQRAEQSVDEPRVAADAVDSLDVDPRDLQPVSPEHALRVVGRGVEIARPAPDAE